MTAIVSTVVVGGYLAAQVVCLMLTGGEALEDFAAGRAKKDLSALLERAPRVAHLLRADGSVQDVPLEQVQPGDRLLVRPAEVVPVDGTLAASAEVVEVVAILNALRAMRAGRGELQDFSSLADPELEPVRESAGT